MKHHFRSALPTGLAALLAVSPGVCASTAPAKDEAAKSLGKGAFKTGATIGTDKRVVEVLSEKDASSLPVPVVSAAELKRAAQTLLANMAAALGARDSAAFTARVPSKALLTVNGVKTDSGKLGDELKSAFAFLDGVAWSQEVLSSSYDATTGLVKLKVKSTYSASLMEPVGVTPASTPVPEEVNSFQRQLKESLKSSGEETYEFKLEGGRLGLSQMTSKLPYAGKGEAAARIAKLLAEWKVKVAVFALFERVEKNDPTGFAALVDSSFQNLDDNGFRQSRTDFLESVKIDLDHLTSLDHSVRVKEIRLDSGFAKARVPIEWDRRARIANSRREWTVSGQATTLTLGKDGEAFKLSLIEGKPLFGNSSRLTRKTLLAGGEIDGTKVTTFQSIDDARTTADASSTDFPENTRALANSTPACPVGNSQTFSFTGAAQQFTVPTACQLIIKAWGAGGGGGGCSHVNSAGAGGGGAYSTTQVSLTNGAVLQVHVAGGGALGTSNVSSTLTGGGTGGFGYGAGGRGGNSGDSGIGAGAGGGGGSSGVTDQAGTTVYLVAAGGGGGGGSHNSLGAAGGAGGQSGASASGAGGTTGVAPTKAGTNGGDRGAGNHGAGGGGGGGGATAGGTGGAASA
ncbi:MAG: hypothetical protein FD126_485, partial [Elusimicrobia bacterium]